MAAKLSLPPGKLCPLYTKFRTGADLGPQREGVPRKTTGIDGVLGKVDEVVRVGVVYDEVNATVGFAAIGRVVAI